MNQTNQRFKITIFNWYLLFIYITNIYVLNFYALSQAPHNFVIR